MITSPERLTKWLAFVATPLSTIAVEHTRFYAVMYPQLRATYEAQGSPCGPREEDMWRWWQGRAQRARSRWLARERRRRTAAPRH